MNIVDNPIDYIVNHQDMFIRQNNVGLQLTVNIINDALLLTDGKVSALRKNNWWIIGSEKDWIVKLSDLSLTEIFHKIIPFPEAGQNSMHGEVLLTAFAEDVVTISNETLIIKGNLSKEDNFLKIMQSNNNWKRIIAFRMPSNLK